jgi:2-amino-4-hydroxy-6-hydroxymethyldihydropteridine diphosphokinase
MTVTCYIGLGSNLLNPHRQLVAASKALSSLPETKLVKVSPFYQTPPLGPPGQPDYLNAVACIETDLDAHTLLSHLQAIERQQGRQRQQHWGPRTLDLDILLFGSAIVNDPQLTIPHPQLRHRAFVLVPLAAIAPGLTLPDGSSVGELLANVATDGIVRLCVGEECASTGQRS